MPQAAVNFRELDNLDEYARAMEAWNGKELGTLGWHIHHQQLAEVLTEPARNRFDFIVNNKAFEEIPIRLRLMRPIQNVPAKVKAAALKHAKATERQQKLAKQYDDKLAKIENTKPYSDPDWKKLHDWYNAKATIAERAVWEASNKYLTAFEMTNWEKLHGEECVANCPWDPDQRNIFPYIVKARSMNYGVGSQI